MKLQAQSSRALCGALQKSAKGVGGKSSIAILDHVLLSRRDDGKYILTSATSDTQLRVPAPLSEIDGQLGKPVALPIDILTRFLATLPDCVVTLNFTGDGEKVKSGKAQFAILPGEDFPMMKEPSEGATHISLPYATFDKILKLSTPFIKNDELRPVMSSMLIDLAEDCSELTFVGTNGQLLYKHGYSNDPQKGGGDFFRGGQARPIKVHSAYFRTIAAFDGVETIDIESDGGIIRFSAGDIDMLCKDLEARFPNYNAVIPKGNPHYITFDKKEMLAIVKRVTLFTTETSNLVKVQKNGMFIDISTEDRDYAQGARPGYHHRRAVRGRFPHRFQRAEHASRGQCHTGRHRAHGTVRAEPPGRADRR